MRSSGRFSTLCGVVHTVFLSEQTGLQLVFNNQETRQVHLAFALCLSMLAFPLLSGPSKTSIPIYDYVLAILGVFVCLYLLFNKTNIADRAGLPTTMDLFVSASGLILIALAVYRTWDCPGHRCIGLCSLCVFGTPRYPEVVQWKGLSRQALWHYWMQTEGVFGVALGVAASLIFLFVLFGALLESGRWKLLHSTCLFDPGHLGAVLPRRLLSPLLHRASIREVLLQTW